ncbi:MAG: LysR family transcriptional regulator [Acidiferrobacterales bacterium]
MRTLKYFVAVFEEKSVSAAAKRCFVAQPSISTAIAQLEDQLATSLFLRHRKGVTPTPEARRLYKVAINLLGEFEALKDMFKEAEEPIPFSLAIMPTIDSFKIGEFVKRITMSSEGLLLRLVDLNEQADARIVSENLRRKTERFVPLWQEKYVLALPQGHRLTLQSSVTLRDLHGIRFIQRCLCERHDEVSSYMKDQHIKPITVARAKNEEWAVALAAAGLGAAMVPESSVRNVDSVVARPIHDLKLARNVGFAYDPSTSSSAAMKRILDDLKTVGRRRAS